MLKRREQRGSVVVEFALAFTGLVLITVSGVTAGLAVQQAILVAHAASAGATYGANNVYDAVTTTGMQTPNVSGMVQAAQGAGQGVTNLTISASYWCTCTAGSTTNQGCTNPCANDQPFTYVSVTAKASITNPLPLGGLPKSFVVQSTAVSQVF